MKSNSEDTEGWKHRNYRFGRCRCFCRRSFAVDERSSASAEEEKYDRGNRRKKHHTVPLDCSETNANSTELRRKGREEKGENETKQLVGLQLVAYNERAESVGSLIAIFTASSNYWVNTRNPRVNTSFEREKEKREKGGAVGPLVRISDAGVARTKEISSLRFSNIIMRLFSSGFCLTLSVFFALSLFLSITTRDRKIVSNLLRSYYYVFIYLAYTRIVKNALSKMFVDDVRTNVCVCREGSSEMQSSETASLVCKLLRCTEDLIFF